MQLLSHLIAAWRRHSTPVDGRGTTDADAAAAAAADEAAPAGPVLPALSPEIEACLSSFDDGLSAAAKAWASGALVPKVNPLRLQRVRAVLAGRDSRAIAALIVEIAAPPNAVSPVSAQTAVNNPVRDQFVRGVMGAVMQAMVEVELARDSAPLTASALLERMRTWIARPQLRQRCAAGTSRQSALDAANENLVLIAREIEHGSDDQAAAMVRQGIVGPLGVALQIIKQLEETPDTVIGLQVAGYEAAEQGLAAAAAVAE